MQTKQLWVHEMENKQLKFKRTLIQNVSQNCKSFYGIFWHLQMLWTLHTYLTHQQMYIQKSDLIYALTTWNIIYENVYSKNYKLQYSHDMCFFFCMANSNQHFCLNKLMSQKLYILLCVSNKNISLWWKINSFQHFF